MSEVAVSNAVAVCNGKITTTSLKLAEVFGKEHKNVIRDIESLQVPEEWHKLNFEPMLYDAQVGNGAIRKNKAYTITRDGFTILAMGFTGARAMQFKLAYIEAFNAMERSLREPEGERPLFSGCVRIDGAKVARQLFDFVNHCGKEAAK